MPVINYIAIDGDERVTAAVRVKDIKGDGFLVMVTRRGEVKRTALAKFANIRANGLIAFDIEEGDELGWVIQSNGSQDIMIVTRNGQSIRFKETAARDRGRTAGGVRAITLKGDDYIVTADLADDEATLLVVGEKGFGKRTRIDEYRVQGRGGSGILTMNVTDKTGKIVSAEVVQDDDKLLVLTTNGKGIRLKVKDVRLVGRIAQGVKLINMAEGDTIASIARLVDAPEEDEDAEGPVDLFDPQ